MGPLSAGPHGFNKTVVNCAMRRLAEGAQSLKIGVNYGEALSECSLKATLVARLGRSSMRKALLLTTAAGLAAFIIQAPAEAQSGAALTGQVSSAKEGAMEGVIVTAKKDGSTIGYSVATDKSGRYSFPAAKLEPGHYALKIRATG